MVKNATGYRPRPVLPFRADEFRADEGLPEEREREIDL